MQVIEMDGTEGPIEPCDIETLEEKLKDPNVKEVKVFRLQKGMVFSIGGLRYKVVRVRLNGKTTIKQVKQV